MMKPSRMILATVVPMMEAQQIHHSHGKPILRIGETSLKKTIKLFLIFGDNNSSNSYKNYRISKKTSSQINNAT